jgi:hypothetical protein
MAKLWENHGKSLENIWCFFFSMQIEV